MNKKDELLNNLDQLHSTEAGIKRLKKNLDIEDGDVIQWCADKIRSKDAMITRTGKNWYINSEHCTITVNASTYTIITAHKDRNYLQ